MYTATCFSSQRGLRCYVGRDIAAGSSLVLVRSACRRSVSYSYVSDGTLTREHYASLVESLSTLFQTYVLLRALEKVAEGDDPRVVPGLSQRLSSSYDTSDHL